MRDATFWTWDDACDGGGSCLVLGFLLALLALLLSRERHEAPRSPPAMDVVRETCLVFGFTKVRAFGTCRLVHYVFY